jgi:hypothetical protein
MQTLQLSFNFRSFTHNSWECPLFIQNYLRIRCIYLMYKEMKLSHDLSYHFWQCTSIFTLNSVATFTWGREAPADIYKEQKVNRLRFRKSQLTFAHAFIAEITTKLKLNKRETTSNQYVHCKWVFFYLSILMSFRFVWMNESCWVICIQRSLSNIDVVGVITLSTILRWRNKMCDKKLASYAHNNCWLWVSP